MYKALILLLLPLIAFASDDCLYQYSYNTTITSINDYIYINNSSNFVINMTAYHHKFNVSDINLIRYYYGKASSNCSQYLVTIDPDMYADIKYNCSYDCIFQFRENLIYSKYIYYNIISNSPCNINYTIDITDYYCYVENKLNYGQILIYVVIAVLSFSYLAFIIVLCCCLSRLYDKCMRNKNNDYTRL